MTSLNQGTDPKKMLEALPLTPNDKVASRSRPNSEGVRPDLSAAYLVAQTEVEQTIAAVWQEVLYLEEVDIHDNFFDLGGDSLLIAKVHNKLGAVLNRDISIVELFKHPTINSLAKYLSPESKEEPDFQKIYPSQEAKGGYQSPNVTFKEKKRIENNSNTQKSTKADGATIQPEKLIR